MGILARTAMPLSTGAENASPQPLFCGLKVSTAERSCLELKSLPEAFDAVARVSLPVDVRKQRRILVRTVGASALSTSIEWYDFMLYGVAAATVFPRKFFPESMRLLARYFPSPLSLWVSSLGQLAPLSLAITGIAWGVGKSLF